MTRPSGAAYHETHRPCPGSPRWGATTPPEPLDPADRSHRRRPGLLLEWRQSDIGTWEGRVVYAGELRAGVWAAVEEWVPAILIEPLG